MKIRSDFVTNSSSANYILELTLKSQDGKTAYTDLFLCGEEGFDSIELYPEKRADDILVGDQSIYSAKNIDKLCDLLFSGATVYGQFEDDECELEEADEESTFVITGKLKYYENREELAEYIEDMGGRVTGSVSSKTDYLICNDVDSTSGKAKKAHELGIPIITEIEFMRRFDEDRYYESMDDNQEDGCISAKNLSPGTVAALKESCVKEGITLDNLKTIIVGNSKNGTGDSAMYINSDNDRFEEYRKKYRGAPEEEKAVILEEFIAFVESGPELEVKDNEYMLPARMQCIWMGNDDDLRKQMTEYLVDGKNGYWMAQYCHEFIIDVSGRNITEREVLYYPCW